MHYVPDILVALKDTTGLCGWVVFLFISLYLSYPRTQEKRESRQQSASDFTRKDDGVDAEARLARTSDSLCISSLFIYPIKSCRGISVPSVNLSTSGFQHDREFVLCALTIRESGEPVYKMLTMRNEPRLSLINTRIEGQCLHVSVDDGASYKKPSVSHTTLSLEADVEHQSSCVSFMLHKTEVTGHDLGREKSRIFSEFLNYDVRVLRRIDSARHVKDDYRPLSIAPEVAFPDQYPLLVLSEASIQDVNNRLSKIGEKQLPIDRFRPNMIVRGISPFGEDDWKTILVAGCKIHLVAPCARCLLPNVDCETGSRSRTNQPYKLLNSYRKVDTNQALKPVLGMHAMVETISGRLQVGDHIMVMSKT